MKSVFQTEKECIVCKTTLNIHCHHIMGGTANRKISEKYGYKIFLCVNHHTGPDGIHFNKPLDVYWKKKAQGHFEQTHSREEFIKTFGRSYI